MSDLRSAISNLAANLNSEGSLFVVPFDRTDPLEQVLRGWSYTLCCATVTPVGANDFFCAIQNIAAEPLVVTHVEFTDAGGEDIELCIGSPSTTPTSAAAAAFTAPNNLVGSVNAAATKANLFCDTDLTTIATTMTAIQRRTIVIATRTEIDLSARPILIGQGQSFALRAVTGTTAITLLRVRYHHIMTPVVAS